MSLAWHDAIAAGPAHRTDPDPDAARVEGIIRAITAFQPHTEPTVVPILPIAVGPAVVVHLSKQQITELFHRMNKKGIYLDAFHGSDKQLKRHAQGRISRAYVFDSSRGLQQNTLFIAPPIYGPVFIQYGEKTYAAIDDAVKNSSTEYLSEMLVRTGAI